MQSDGGVPATLHEKKDTGTMMRLFRRSSKRKLGLSPGSVVNLGDRREEPVLLDVIDSSATDYRAERAALDRGEVGKLRYESYVRMVESV